MAWVWIAVLAAAPPAAPAAAPAAEPSETPPRSPRRRLLRERRWSGADENRRAPAFAVVVDEHALVAESTEHKSPRVEARSLFEHAAVEGRAPSSIISYRRGSQPLSAGRGQPPGPPRSSDGLRARRVDEMRSDAQPGPKDRSGKTPRQRSRPGALSIPPDLRYPRYVLVDWHRRATSGGYTASSALDRFGGAQHPPQMRRFCVAAFAVLVP